MQRGLHFFREGMCRHSTAHGALTNPSTGTPLFLPAVSEPASQKLVWRTLLDLLLFLIPPILLLQDRDWDLCLDVTNHLHIATCCGKSPASKEGFALGKATPMRWKSGSQMTRGRKWEHSQRVGGQAREGARARLSPTQKVISTRAALFQSLPDTSCCASDGKWDRTTS